LQPPGDRGAIRGVAVTETKGQSETHPVLSPTDEFANYEILSNLLGNPAGRIPHIIGSYSRFDRWLYRSGSLAARITRWRQSASSPTWQVPRSAGASGHSIG
jgi:hypothetical protein